MAVAVEIPDTVRGTRLSLPRMGSTWPALLDPQHDTEPFVRSAQVCNSPREMAVAVAIPRTLTGMRTLFVPFWPSWPELPNPQHHTEPPVSSAQV
jgi:hypothetical protein